MWIVVLTAYNLPPWLCMKDLYLVLTLLILGPRAPNKDMNVFLQSLIDELKELWVETWDVVNNSVFKMGATLLCTVNDFPAWSGWSGQCYKACLTCNKGTPSLCVRGKNVYFGYRRFLPMTHPMRSSRKSNEKAEKRPPPKRFIIEDILRQISQLLVTLSS